MISQGVRPVALTIRQILTRPSPSGVPRSAEESRSSEAQALRGRWTTGGVFRTEHGISQEDPAELVDPHRNYISQIECGQRNLSLLNILNFARALRLPASRRIEHIR
jgi:DNA-binding XRE family transcriptional regulator